MTLILVLPVLLFSVVVHEMAHAWQALREGDSTPRDMGRITINPLKHLDPVGSLAVPLVLHFWVPGDVLFAWARPVRVNPANYRDLKWGDIRVSLAGVVCNLALVVLCASALAALRAQGHWVTVDARWLEPITAMLVFGVVINLLLSYVNLIPVPPLDGSHVLYRLLPASAGERYRVAGSYGAIALLVAVLAFPGVLQTVLMPVSIAGSWILGLAGG